MRNSIKSLFPQRECLALVRPHHSEKELRRLDQLQFSDLREEFQQGVKDLHEMILNQVKPKIFGDKTLDGALLAHMVETYVKAINEGAVPTIASAWESVAEAQCVKAVQMASERFQNALQVAQVRADESAMRCYHEDTLKEALAIFDEAAAGPLTMRESYRNQLNVDLSQKFQAFKSRKFLEAEIACLHALSKAEAGKRDLIDKLKGGNVDQGAFFAFVESFVQQYCEEEHGQSKHDLLCKFLLSCIEDLTTKCVHAAESEVIGLKKELSELHQKHGEDIQKKEAAFATMKEVLKAETEHKNILFKREQARNKRLTNRVNALQHQLENSNSNVKYTSAVVEKWAAEAAEAAKTPPKQLGNIDLCDKFQSSRLSDVTNQSQ